jgi:two-component system sensor histidine kinase/response regulator
LERGNLSIGPTASFQCSYICLNAFSETGSLAKGLELAGLLPPKTPTHLRGDPGRIRQVLTNLVGNAIKFTESGEVVVQVSEVCRDTVHVTMRLQIMDIGIGIAPETQARLFQAFTQADGSTTRKYGGSGLGLAICKRLVEMIEGEIGIESKLGGGSLFWFTVKLKHQVAPISLKHRRTDSLANIKVLVVDDNATNGRVLHYQLAALNMPDEYASPRGESSVHAPYRRRGRYTLPPGDPGHADARYDGRLSARSCHAI